MMIKSKIQFSKLLFEFISVSFAVLLALFVNQWREDRSNSDLADQAIHNIKEEFIENKGLMIELIPNHKLLLTELNNYTIIEGNEAAIKKSIESLDITLINSSAWEMAKVTNVVFYINYDDVNNLAKVYNLQSYYESMVKQYLLSNAVKNQKNDAEDELGNTKQFLTSIIPIEEDLQMYYDLILTEILKNKNE